MPVLDNTERRKNAANEFLICRTASNFILTLGKEIQFIDRNKASLRWGKYNGDDVFDNDDNGEINVLSRCGGESEEKLKPTYFAPYFYALQSYFTTNIIGDKDVKDGASSQSSQSSQSSTEKKPYTLDKEELYELHEKKAFNPKYLFRSRLHKKDDSKSTETTETTEAIDAIYSIYDIFDWFDFFDSFVSILKILEIYEIYKQYIQEVQNVQILYM
ncbi:hypothetical protein MHF_0120 [Mycoplasma haemofelis Ohio2]|uniref:Uncharacterized protein n=1 Tax=Mycoplasma haemofelis (strain Ohio2) TaxID=859194 RepID=F6FFM9_MYCHI|nr:hypothetical protein MHF_0120 [Mycoplasma haemofelis Ohio2]